MAKKTNRELIDFVFSLDNKEDNGTQMLFDEHMGEYYRPGLTGRQEAREFLKEKKDLKDNKLANKLQVSMIEYVYPRILQLMKDFDLTNFGTSDAKIAINNMFAFSNKNEELYITLRNQTINISRNKLCPIFNSYNLNPTEGYESVRSAYTNNKLFLYNKYCNVVMDILKQLDDKELEINKTISRAESISLKISSFVIIEKLKR